MISVLPLLVNPRDQRVSSGIRMCIHGHAVGRTGVRHPGHVCDGVLAITTGHIVAVEVVTRHDELEG